MTDRQEGVRLQLPGGKAQQREERVSAKAPRQACSTPARPVLGTARSDVARQRQVTEDAVGLWKDHGSDPMEGFDKGECAFNLDS